MNGPVVELRSAGLVHRRRGAAPVAALRSVDLRVHAGERVAVVGRSGAGKSSLARVLLGLDRVTHGSVRVLGHDLASLRARELRRVRRRMHLVFQDPYDSLHPGWSVEALVGEPVALAGVRARADRRRVVAGALERVGLGADEDLLGRRPSALSGGQRQRVALARALVTAPALVVADEPASMLDAALRTLVVELLLEVQAEHGAALVYVTHDLAVARHVAERVVVMQEGTVVDDGPVDVLLRRPAHPESERLVAAARALHSLPPGRGGPTGG
ncbi:MAG: ABC transporter ATP-binding protein [Actinomycetes bacterium]